MIDHAASSSAGELLVSIGIPTYNRADLLDRRLENVLGQTYQNLEVIVSDNASPNPEVARVVQKWCSRDTRVKSFRQTTNIGATGNFLFVMDQAVGEYFAWAADDDEWDKDYIEITVSGIGAAQLYMPSAAVWYIKSGEQSPLNLPNLNTTDGHYHNAKRFFENAQPSIIYGLHKLSEIKKSMPRTAFDLSDVLVVYKAVLGGGVITGGPSEYRAGFPEETYVVKPFGRLGSTHKLSYRAALAGCLFATFKSENLYFYQRVILAAAVVRLIFRTADHLARTYPDVARSHHLLLSRVMMQLDRTKVQLRRLYFWR
ncbi:Glycosyl transferase family 2 [Devosia sp. YR412]|uniref:glycosyltransferase family 2 protein n=1 Tax=Devosia sp. YR412 TaxID=1881030 RepID=UPI0008AF67F7|nr:glycosyltransferase family 2 protein [Devosia sp. YR412]SEQ32149.1 Glycosyl transferase family 2 [Devosia sp. YR412]